VYFDSACNEAKILELGLGREKIGGLYQLDISLCKVRQTLCYFIFLNPVTLEYRNTRLVTYLIPLGSSTFDVLGSELDYLSVCWVPFQCFRVCHKSILFFSMLGPIVFTPSNRYFYHYETS
jgi:uncharacterized membrane protein YwaF